MGRRRGREQGGGEGGEESARSMHADIPFMDKMREECIAGPRAQGCQSMTSDAEVVGIAGWARASA